MELWPGRPYPLGATWTGAGVNFALFSEQAAAVWVCLFDDHDAPVAELQLTEYTDRIWHGFVPGLAPGQRYGFRVDGLYDPTRGLRFNRHKLLVDPYAKAFAGTETWNEALFGYQHTHPAGDLSLDRRDSAPFVPKAVVIDPSFSWGNDALPRTPLANSVIYEMHVKGFTRAHPDVTPMLRGTYAGLAAPASIDYLRELGITAVDLLPIHQHADERHLWEKRLTNYWGYNSLNYFAPDIRYAADKTPGGAVREFKTMVKALHAAGIEVILDVVYNHTAEAAHNGPTFSQRGIDNRAYYCLRPSAPRYYLDFTGCGNTLDMGHFRNLQLVMDSLRYWVTEMHVDGFRFDLAPALLRSSHGGARASAFLEVVHQDPIVSQVKLIAEPWDVGEGGYHVGNFPIGWCEWNDKYRDTMRGVWRGDATRIREWAYRLTGSSDLYRHNGRRPYASINFVTAHDGFTLHDLVSYNHKHNLANGENNRDGSDHNLSYNHGVEGPTDNPKINALRLRLQRNFLATLFLSQGVPMLCAGDEWSRTQRGNNNAYCQDNATNWFDWRWNDEQEALFRFTKYLIALRRAHPLLHRADFFQGRLIHGAAEDICWLRPDGTMLSDNEWEHGVLGCVGVLLNDTTANLRDERGQLLRDDQFLLVVNVQTTATEFTLPPGSSWLVVFDTSEAVIAERPAADARLPLAPQTLVLLRRQVAIDEPITALPSHTTAG